MVNSLNIGGVFGRLKSLEDTPDSTPSLNQALLADASGNFVYSDILIPSQDNTLTDQLTVQKDGTSVFQVQDSLLQNLIEVDTTNGKFVIRQPGGTAGTDEVQIRHDGTNAIFGDGDDDDLLRLKGSNNQVYISALNFTGSGGLGNSVVRWSTLYTDNTLDVDLNSDTQAAIFKANSSQTNNLTEWQDSAGNVLSAVDSSGNVGIGTSSSSSNLHVHGTDAGDLNKAGTIQFSNDDTSSNAYIVMGGPGNLDNRLKFLVNPTNQNDFTFAVEEDDLRFGSGININLTGDDARFQNTENIAWWKPKDTTGGVGPEDSFSELVGEGLLRIGTWSSTQGTDQDMMNLYASNDTDGKRVEVGNKFWVFGENAGDVQSIIQGASSQTANLTEWQDSDGTILSHVDSSGNLSVGQPSTGGGTLNVGGNVQLDSGDTIFWGSASGIIEAGSTTDTLTIGTGFTTAITIDSSQNVGIGGSPSHLLDLNATNPVLRLQGATNDTDGSKIRFTETANFQGGYLHYNGTTNSFIMGVHDDDDTNLANDVDAVIVDRLSGNVGVGGTPVETFTIVDSSDDMLAYSGGGEWRLDFSEDKLDFRIDRNNGNASFQLTEADVFGTNDFFFQISGRQGTGSTDWGVLEASSGATQGLQVATQDAVPIVFSPNRTEQVRLTSSGNLGVKTNSPNSTVDNNGSYGSAITTVSSNTTLDNSHSTVLVDTSGGSITVTLPTASSASRRVYNIKKVTSANTLTIDGDSTETIDGSETQDISNQYDSVSIQSDGTEWWII